MTITVLFITLFVCVTGAKAAPRKPVSAAAKRWHPDPGWLRQAFCVHRHESSDWYRAGIDWAGNPSPYYGGFQFLISTWRAAGGAGLPSDWAPREQFYRAWITWLRSGRSWSQWGTRGVCGLA